MLLHLDERGHDVTEREDRDTERWLSWKTIYLLSVSYTHLQRQEGIVQETPTRKPEADIAHAAGDMDLATEAPAQLGDRVQAVSAILAVDSDGEDERVDEYPLQRDARCKRRLNHCLLYTSRCV